MSEEMKFEEFVFRLFHGLVTPAEMAEIEGEEEMTEEDGSIILLEDILDADIIDA